MANQPKSACGSACGAADPKKTAPKKKAPCKKPQPKPSACGSACGAADPKKK